MENRWNLRERGIIFWSPTDIMRFAVSGKIRKEFLQIPALPEILRRRFFLFQRNQGQKTFRAP